MLTYYTHIFTATALSKVLFDGGYAQMSGNTPTYMFFLTDHLGSVRVVADENGNVRQVNQYYPYGELIEDANMAEGTSDNRYRFTGKELATETGLYDFCARYLETSMGRFTTIDPLAEKYPSISPYVYCAGDPVNYVDPDGRDRWIINQDGSLSAIEADNTINTIQIIRNDGDYSEIFNIANGITLSVENNLVQFLASNIRGGMSIFMFLSQNTNVEYGIVNYIDFDASEEEKSLIITNGMVNGVNMIQYVRSINENENYITSIIHSHPNGTLPSGFGELYSKEMSDKISRGAYQKELVEYIPSLFVYSKTNNLFYRYDNSNKEAFDQYIWRNNGFQSTGKKSKPSSK